MPINAYTGLMGSGKTYEVVGFVILPALLKGRRVVTNIEGLDYEKIKAYLHEKHPDAKLGELVTVTNDQVEAEGFFPSKDGQEDAVVKGGDMVCLDEAWRFFGTGVKLRPSTMVFLREHRHYTDPKTAVSCDLVLMLQSITDLQKVVKNVVELTFKTQKLKTVGLNRRYRLDMFEGTDMKLSRRADTFQKGYEKSIYDLYHSYAAGTGKEVAIDTRQNVLRNPRNIAMMVGVLVLFIAGAFALNHLYSRYAKPKPDPLAAAGDGTAPGAAPGAPAARAPAAPAAPPKPLDSEAWRLAGRIVTPRGERAVLVGSSARVRVEDPAMFMGYGWDRKGMIEGERVSAWSGPAVGAVNAPAESKSSVLSVGK